MKTPLDSAEWFLEHINYSEYQLEVVLTEVFKCKQESDKYEYVYSLEKKPESRSFQITFDEVVTFQVTEEIVLESNDDEEIESAGTLSKLKKSPFLQYVESNCMLFGRDGYKHYSLVTVNEIIDIISTEEPTIEQIELLTTKSTRTGNTSVQI